MNTSDSSPDKVVRAVYAYAAQLMRDGVPPPEIETKLTERGLDAEAARVVVANLKAARSKALQEAGRKNVLWGSVIFLIGAGVTAVSYQMAASSPKGGGFIVAGGAIVFGAIAVIRGLFQLSSE